MRYSPQFPRNPPFHAQKVSYHPQFISEPPENVQTHVTNNLEGFPISSLTASMLFPLARKSALSHLFEPRFEVGHLRALSPVKERSYRSPETSQSATHPIPAPFYAEKRTPSLCLLPQSQNVVGHSV